MLHHGAHVQQFCIVWCEAERADCKSPVPLGTAAVIYQLPNCSLAGATLRRTGAEPGGHAGSAPWPRRPAAARSPGAPEEGGPSELSRAGSTPLRRAGRKLPSAPGRMWPSAPGTRLPGIRDSALRRAAFSGNLAALPAHQVPTGRSVRVFISANPEGE
ncbi:hypothetical protein NDU88_002315 [Pleurodeles waltl]|uniref:Uncharacterized protein n=1 Tax=Pleurodeles waltl TaxID=8319 RepID=A0AAV7WPY0_PLEWA|nr:hypothetical protein NDU88_002315 [Pleurodeles waltl]